MAWGDLPHRTMRTMPASGAQTSPFMHATCAQQPQSQPHVRSLAAHAKRPAPQPEPIEEAEIEDYEDGDYDEMEGFTSAMRRCVNV